MEPKPAPESLVSLLDQLQDIVEPPPISMAPATWGWTLLAVLVVAILGLALRAWLRHRRATAYRRAALAELRSFAPALSAGEPSALARLEVLLRRTALAAFPRAEVATLSGDAWSGFLERTGGAFGALGPVIATAPYRPSGAFDGPAALASARHWIRHHHV